MPRACELKNKLSAFRVPLVLCTLILTIALAAATDAVAQPAHQPPETEAREGEHAASAEHGMFSGLLWPTVNFVILFGGLWWFLRDPVATYLRERHTAIRQELVEAAALKAAAIGQLGDIDRKLQALPGELDALRKRASEEIVAEEQRIRAAAAAERERLLEQTRREIDLQVRLAKRALVEHAADLAVELAGDRLTRQITPEDQDRLVDRYLSDVRERQA